MKILATLICLFFCCPTLSYAFDLETDVPTDCSNMPDKESETVCAMAKYFKTTIPQILGIQMVVEGEIAIKICGFKSTGTITSVKNKLLKTSHLRNVYNTMHKLSVEPLSRSQWCNHIYSMFGPSSGSKTPFFK